MVHASLDGEGDLNLRASAGDNYEPVSFVTVTFNEKVRGDILKQRKNARSANVTRDALTEYLLSKLYGE